MMRRAVANRNIRSTGFGEDKSPANRHDNDHDHDHNDNTGFVGETQSICLGATTPMTFLASFLMTKRTSMRMTWSWWVQSARPKKEDSVGLPEKSRA